MYNCKYINGLLKKPLVGDVGLKSVKHIFSQREQFLKKYYHAQ